MDATRGVAIVAIPSEEDYVWKISSEKVPHLTLLHLGDLTEDMDVVGMADFLEHVADISMCRFGLDVERRDELGEKQADVLIFRRSQSEVKRLETIRSYLLTNPAISKAYHSTEQFPIWVPHLTLGYPETPANPDTREYPGTRWVNFDRVALWVGDYNGPDFDLDDKYYDMEVRMSAEETGAAFLEHYGIKGMRWGVRRSRRPAPSTDYKNTKKITDKARKGGVKSLTNKQLKTATDRLSAEKKFTDARSQASTTSKGHNAVKNILAIGGTVSAAYALSTSPAAKAGASHVAKLVKPGIKSVIKVIAKR